jgi:hypothetical protein
MTSDFALWFSDSLRAVSRAQRVGSYTQPCREEAIRQVEKKFKLSGLDYQHPAVNALMCALAVMPVLNTIDVPRIAEIYGHMLRAWEEYQKIDDVHYTQRFKRDIY